jgi:aminopeptidase N
MSRWAADESDQGPVYLGYRVGHIRNDGRAFRSIVYNKGALLLHMLRLMVGDETFFKGIRRFYAESRYRKVGTDNFRRAMEAESGRPLDRFFERWVYNSTLPKLTFSHRVEHGDGGQEAVLHFEQKDEIFDVPVVVTLQFTDRRELNVVVPLTDKTVDFRVPFEGVLRSVEIKSDAGGLANVTRN